MSKETEQERRAEMPKNEIEISFESVEIFLASKGLPMSSFDIVPLWAHIDSRGNLFDPFLASPIGIDDANATNRKLDSFAHLETCIVKAIQSIAKDKNCGMIASVKFQVKYLQDTSSEKFHPIFDITASGLRPKTGSGDNIAISFEPLEIFLASKRLPIGQFDIVPLWITCADIRQNHIIITDILDGKEFANVEVPNANDPSKIIRAVATNIIGSIAKVKNCEMIASVKFQVIASIGYLSNQSINITATGLRRKKGI